MEQLRQKLASFDCVPNHLSRILTSFRRTWNWNTSPSVWDHSFYEAFRNSSDHKIAISQDEYSEYFKLKILLKIPGEVSRRIMEWLNDLQKTINIKRQLPGLAALIFALGNTYMWQLLKGRISEKIFKLTEMLNIPLCYMSRKNVKQSKTEKRTFRRKVSSSLLIQHCTPTLQNTDLKLQHTKYHIFW